MGEPTQKLSESQKDVIKVSSGKNPVISELLEDFKWLEKQYAVRARKGKIMKGVSLREQAARLTKMEKAGKYITMLAKRCNKAVKAQSDRLWSGCKDWNEDDKEMALELLSDKWAQKEEKASPSKKRKIQRDVD